MFLWILSQNCRIFQDILKKMFKFQDFSDIYWSVVITIYNEFPPGMLKILPDT